jgi:phage shock protein E
MISKIKQLLGIKAAPDFNKIYKEGGVIVDVRSKAEYKSGHVKGSKNIPLPDLPSSLGMLKDKSKPIITCCASGMRSASAKNILQSKGYTKVYNGGSWSALKNKIDL